MSEFNPGKLHVFFDEDIDTHSSILPRKYTLTHSDKTGELFLHIGQEYNYRALSSLYSRLLRDEVLGEWQDLGQIRLDLHCHVSGGIAFGPAKWREAIFRHHMKMVLQAIFFGDRFFLMKNKDFLGAPAYLNFHARRKKLDSIEKWGIISDYMPGDH